MNIFRNNLLLSVCFLISLNQTHVYGTEKEFLSLKRGFFNQSSTPSKNKPLETEITKKESSIIKKGFLLNNPSPKSLIVTPSPKKVESIPVSCETAIVPLSIPLIFTEGEKDNTEYADFPEKSIWSHPYLKDQQMYKLLLKYMGNPDDGFMGFFYDALNSNNMFSLINPQVDFVAFLKECTHCNEKAKTHVRIFNSNLNTPDLASFLFQCFNHQVVEKFFSYMKSLSIRKQQDFTSQFLLPNSDDNQGEFFIDPDQWRRLAPNQLIPRIRYYRQTTSDQEKIFRIYMLDPQPIEHFGYYATSLPHHSSLSAYGTGEIEYINENATTNMSAFILDKAGKLVEKSGLAFIKGLNSSKYSSLVAYDRHPILDQMFFFEKQVFSEETFNKLPDDSLLSTLLNSVGGISTLDKEKFIFIPDPEEDGLISPSSAHFLLPHAYYIKDEMAKGNPEYANVQQHLLEYTIQELEQVLVEELCATVGEIPTTGEIAIELASGVIEQGLEIKNPQLIEQLTEQQNLVYAAYPRPEGLQTGKQKQRWNKKHKEKAKKEAIQELKTEKAKTIDPEAIQQRRKERALARIEEKYLKETAQKKHFDSSEAQELIAQMTEELSSLGISETGTTHVRGSHVGGEIVSKDTDHTTKLGIARRPQKRGYQAGTVRTIIKDHATKVLSILKRKKT